MIYSSNFQNFTPETFHQLECYVDHECATVQSRSIPAGSLEQLGSMWVGRQAGFFFFFVVVHSKQPKLCPSDHGLKTTTPTCTPHKGQMEGLCPHGSSYSRLESVSKLKPGAALCSPVQGLLQHHWEKGLLLVFVFNFLFWNNMRFTEEWQRKYREFPYTLQPASLMSTSFLTRVHLSNWDINIDVTLLTRHFIPISPIFLLMSFTVLSP